MRYPTHYAKTITGVHGGDLLDIAPTYKEVAIDVIDVVRLENGQYAEHWGINKLSSLLMSLKHA